MQKSQFRVFTIFMDNNNHERDEGNGIYTVPAMDNMTEIVGGGGATSIQQKVGLPVWPSRSWGKFMKPFDAVVTKHLGYLLMN